MARRKASTVDERKLTKGQLRKLNALRKSIGPEIGERAFLDWMESQPQTATLDEDAKLMADILWQQVEKGRLRIPRSGYVVRRGRGRIIVERIKSE